MRASAASALALAALAFALPALGQVGGRFVDVIEVIERDDQVDVTVQFNCSMRYITQAPPSEGKQLRIQLEPLADCGLGAFARGLQLTSELPPVSGGAGILGAARLESDAPGQLSLLLTFGKSEHFAVAQGVDPRGLRIRLFNPAPAQHGHIVLGEQGDTVSNFAINLDSQLKPFDPAAIARAHELLKVPVFVSEKEVEGQKWYRLRAGPLDRRQDAERLLAQALTDYPRAWLAIGDDTSTTAPTGSINEPALPGVQRMGADPPLDAATLKKLVADAEHALAARDYPRAITLLTQLQRQPEFPARAHVQELLGLARERAGQLAHAKAEYEEYLRRYPDGEAGERVALRLRILRSATEQPRTGSGGTAPPTGWTVSGGFAQQFRYDGLNVDNNQPAGAGGGAGGAPVPNSVTTSTDELFTDLDLLARRRGENIDFTGRFSGGYNNDFSGQTGPGLGSSKRLSIASVELLDRPLGLLARLGRQIHNEDGILGTFDGLFLAEQFLPAWSLHLSAGYPVDLTTNGLHTAQRFEGAALAYAPQGAHWDMSLFTQLQQFDGFTDRESVGFNLRYLAQKASLIVLTDYDIFYHSLNAASLIGTVKLPARWTLSVDAERRNSPVLTTANALIGQPVTTLSALEPVFTEAQIYQLARDRTPATFDYSLTATHPLGERFQVAVTVAADETQATPESGGVPAQPSTGLEKLVQMQLYGNSVWFDGDFDTLTLQYSDTSVGKIQTLAITTRFPAIGAWRIGPRLTIDRETILADGSKLVDAVPSVLIDYQKGRHIVQFEVGGEIGRRDATLQTQNTKRYYVSLAYRLGF